MDEVSDEQLERLIRGFGTRVTARTLVRVLSNGACADGRMLSHRLTALVKGGGIIRLAPERRGVAGHYTPKAW
jgi:hypothetical protein